MADEKLLTEKDFQEFYDKRLKEKLRVLEAFRKNILRRYFYSIFLLAGLAGANYYLVSKNPPQYLLIISIGLSATGGLWYIIVTFGKKSKYRKRFKSDVVAEIIGLYNPEWQYLYDSCITQDQYQLSRIFPQHFDRYSGDDLVVGEIDKTDFQYSELHTQYKQETHGSKGERDESWVTIFKGLFMHADFNKKFSGTTFVLPDTAERLFGSFGQKLQKLSSRGELVKLEDPVFEKRFVVYSSNQVEARYILTPAIMENMVRLADHVGGKVYFSFVGSRVYFARSFSKDLFEPNVFRSGVNFSDAKQMFELLGMITELIQELNLNTRIWTKE